MGQGAINYQGVKGGGNFSLQNTIEEFQHVYQGKTINAGDFVSFIQGVKQSKTVTPESPLKFSGTDKANAISVCQVDDERVFIAYNKQAQNTTTNGNGYAVVAKIKDGNISLGTEVLFYDYNCYYIDTAFRPSNQVIIFFGQYTAMARTASLTDMIITFVDEAVTISETTGNSYPDVDLAITSCEKDKLLVSWCRNSSSVSSTYGLKTCVLTMGTFSPIKNTVYTLSNYICRDIGLGVIDSSHVLLTCRDNQYSLYNYGRILTITGTTIVSGAATALNNSRGDYAELKMLSPTKAILCYSGYASSPAFSACKILTVSTTSVSAGTAYNFATAYVSYPSLTAFSEGLAGLVYHDSTAGQTGGASKLCEINGTSITYTAFHLFGDSSSSTPQYISSCIVLRDKIFIAYMDVADSNYGKIRVLDTENKILSNQLIIRTYEPQVTNAKSHFNGIALTSGEGGTNLQAKDTIKIALASNFYTSQNLIINSNFNNGLTNWELLDTTYFTVSTTTKNNRSCLALKLTSPTDAGATRQISLFDIEVKNFPQEYGHLFFAGFDFCGDELSEKITPLIAHTDGTSRQSLSGGIDIASTNNWQTSTYRRQSSISNCNRVYLPVYTQHASYTIPANTTLYLTNFRLYDLTTMFGKGCEPDLTWCNENL